MRAVLLFLVALLAFTQASPALAFECLSGEEKVVVSCDANTCSSGFKVLFQSKACGVERGKIETLGEYELKRLFSSLRQNSSAEPETFGSGFRVYETLGYNPELRLSYFRSLDDALSYWQAYLYFFDWFWRFVVLMDWPVFLLSLFFCLVGFADFLINPRFGHKYATFFVAVSMFSIIPAFYTFIEYELYISGLLFLIVPVMWLVEFFILVLLRFLALFKKTSI